MCRWRWRYASPASSSIRAPAWRCAPSGNNHASAHMLGVHVIRTRFLAVLFGGACSGLAGGYLSLAYTPQWVEGMTAGRGWIALALVVFCKLDAAARRRRRYLFGGALILQFHAQAEGIPLPSQFLSALPYIATVAALVIALARPMEGEERLAVLPRTGVRPGPVGCLRPAALSTGRKPIGEQEMMRATVLAVFAAMLALPGGPSGRSRQGGVRLCRPDRRTTAGPTQHDQGRLAVEKAFGDKVETLYVENVAEGPDAERRHRAVRARRARTSSSPPPSAS